MATQTEAPRRIFGPAARKTTNSHLFTEDNSRVNQNFRNNDIENTSTVSRTFGLKLKHSTFDLNEQYNSRFIQETESGNEQSEIFAGSGTFGLGMRRFKQNQGLPLGNNGRFNHENKNDLDHCSALGQGVEKAPLRNIRSGLYFPERPQVTPVQILNNQGLSMASSSFGLQPTSRLRNSIFNTNQQLSSRSIQESVYKSSNEPVNISTTSGAFGLRHYQLNQSLLNNGGRVNHELKNSMDLGFAMVPSSVRPQTSIGTSSHFEERSRINQESIITNYKNIEDINSSASLRTLGPVARTTALSVGSRIQDRLRLNNDDIDDKGFRRPNVSRIIRGRNSIISSRLFSHQTVDRYSRDLSNANGFNVSHISRIGFDTMSESRLGLNLRHNGMDMQSVAGSMGSVASAKAQFMNLLENLHHSILNIVPGLPVEAVRMEFDKVKEGLENINEMSFAPTVKENDAASIISHSSRIIGPSASNQITNGIDGDFIPLKTGRDVLRGLSSKRSHESNESPQSLQEMNQPAFVATLQNFNSDEEELEDVFKKPKPPSKWKKTTRIIKKKSPKQNKTLVSKVKEKNIVCLKQWYPVAEGTNLAFYGVDDNGATIKTEPVKKRVNNRIVELINGMECNLVGSPSASIVSALPAKIMSFLKNGLADRWRVLQKELVNCQTHEASPKRRRSKSPKKAKKIGVLSSPKKMEKKDSPARKVKRKATSPKKTPEVEQPKRLEKKDSPAKKVKKKVTSPKKSPEVEQPKKLEKKDSPAKKVKRKATSPKKSPEVEQPKKMTKKVAKQKNESDTALVSTSKTRSGRKIKPPGMFWLVSGSDEVSSSVSAPGYEKIKEKNVNVEKKTQKVSADVTLLETPSKRKRKPVIATPIKKGTRAYRKTPVKKARKKSQKVAKVTTPKKSAKTDYENEAEELVTVHSSTEVKPESNRPKSQTKRKREVGDADSTQRKKSKSVKRPKAEVESMVEDEPPAKTSKKGSHPKVHSPKAKAKNSPAPKKKEAKKNTLKKTSEQVTETKDFNDFEEDFELQLDDIEIPEFSNIDSKPQLSKSQLRIISMETPPLKYFNNNLKLLRSATPVRSPDWCISQRTDSEVKQFQRRRAEAYKKKIQIEVKKTVIKEKTKSMAPSKDLKNVLDWVADKHVRTPKWSSKVLQYVIPSRKQMELDEEDEEEEDEGRQSEF